MIETTILEWVQNAYDWVPKDVVSEIFVVCVNLMYLVCGVTGISYEALNIWLFVILQPSLILLSSILWMWGRSRRRCSNGIDIIGFKRVINSTRLKTTGTVL